MKTYECIFLVVIFILIISSLISFTFAQKSAKRVHRVQKKAITNKEIAGATGEMLASRMLHKVMRDDDLYFSNVEIEVDGRYAELDSIVVNQFGVYIFEVKNYKGEMKGNVDDYEWEKYNTTKAGYVYGKTVKNPIKQVKREVYLLSQYLNRYGVKVWIDGYVILIKRNSPVLDEHIIFSVGDMDKAIHKMRKNDLSKHDIQKISKLLS